MQHVDKRTDVDSNDPKLDGGAAVAGGAAAAVVKGSVSASVLDTVKLASVVVMLVGCVVPPVTGGGVAKVETVDEAAVSIDLTGQAPMSKEAALARAEKSYSAPQDARGKYGRGSMPFPTP